MCVVAVFVIRLPAKRSGHECLDRPIDIEMTCKNSSNGFADWKRQMAPCLLLGQADHGGCRCRTLDESPWFLREPDGIGALADRHAKSHIARRLTGGSEHQVAKSGKAHQGFPSSTKGLTEPRQFDKPTCDQSGFGIVAKPAALDHTRSDRKHILDRATDLDPNQIVSPVKSELLMTHRRSERTPKSFIGTGESGCRR